MADGWWADGPAVVIPRVSAVAGPIALLLGTLVVGCDRPAASHRTVASSPTGLAVDQARVPDRRWAATCPIPSDAPAAPIGRTAEMLIARYGVPATTDLFVLGEAIDPVRRSVRNAFSSPVDPRRTVREMMWHADGCELLIWLAERGGQWGAVQSLRTPSGGEH